ncbi:GntR family transcriptional regulator [Pelagibius litoralis]|uniref:GntR family transcriptional regulator n=1 Tax=Pelagibius litoralis TaxID=374515 RepID=A0A967KDW6_9PROT|nr:GntR family transcriptional regulator [Pelagibius litoralis]NIA70440.1 GntR family transcriptional regulator [Pelagibius litoralis]
MKESKSLMPRPVENGHVLRDQVYADISNALMMGHYVPGQKLVIRQLAESYGTSLTPVRECLGRLVAEGVLEGEAKRSVRVPRMTSARVRELRDIRLAVEGLAAARAAERITLDEVARLRIIASEIIAAREREDIATDVAKLGEFQFGVYRASAMPNLVRIIESLWLQTGPYLRLLFPNYIQTVTASRGDWRGRLCAALETRDVEVARREIEADVGEALEYLITLVDAADVIGSNIGRVVGLGTKKAS